MRVLLVLLGASKFERMPYDYSSPVFYASHKALRAWLLHRKHGPFVAAEDSLNLFDSKRSWPDQETKVADWLRARVETQSVPTDLIIHYVGHGGFRDNSKDYYLAIRASHPGNPYYSSLMVDSLWRVLRENARSMRRHLIIDACFSAAAARQMMAPLQEVVSVKLRALQEMDAATTADRTDPDRGSICLCSSSDDEPSDRAGIRGLTQFTDGLLEVLNAGLRTATKCLSFAQIRELLFETLQDRYGEKAVLPQLQEGKQRGRSLLNFPIFPNLAWRPSGEQTEKTVKDSEQIDPDQSTRRPSTLHLASKNTIAKAARITDRAIARSSAGAAVKVMLTEVRAQINLAALGSRARWRRFSLKASRIISTNH